MPATFDEFRLPGDARPVAIGKTAWPEEYQVDDPWTEANREKQQPATPRGSGSGTPPRRPGGPTAVKKKPDMDGPFWTGRKASPYGLPSP